MRRALLSVLLLLGALVLQLTVVNRLPLPGGVSPDLVLLVVVALALSSSPMAGLISGFCAGLALDIAPPSDHLIGLYALVFCLVGYCCGLVSAELDSSVLLPLAASALGAAGGAGLYAAAGVILGSPDVTGVAVRHVLPLSVLYDVLLSPFVLYGVALASRLSARMTGAAQPSGEAVARQPAALRQGGRGFRPRPAAASPRDGWIGGGGWLAASAELARRPPATVRLHLGGQRTAAVPARTGTGTGAPRLRFGAGRRGDAVLGSRLLGGGFFSELGNGGRGLPGASGGRRLFTRRSRRGGATFSASTPHPRTLSPGSPRRRTLSPGSPRRGAFGGGSSARGWLGKASTRRATAGGGPRRLRSLRTFRTFRTFRKVAFRGGSPGRGALGRVRGGRSPAWRRIGRNRSGGYR
jgi:rod shape-determining protein MreD